MAWLVRGAGYPQDENHHQGATHSRTSDRMMCSGRAAIKRLDPCCRWGLVSEDLLRHVPSRRRWSGSVEGMY